MRPIIYTAWAVASAVLIYQMINGNYPTFLFKIGYAVVCLFATWAWRSARTDSLVSEMYSRYDRPGQSKIPTYHE